MNKKIKKVAIYAAIALVVIIAALPKLRSMDGEEKTAAMPLAGQGRTGAGAKGAVIKAYVIKNDRLGDKLLASGTILANDEVELRSETSGRIEKIIFKEGSHVSKGALLIKINDSELQAQLLKANYRKKLAADKEYRQRMMLQKEAISQEEYEVSLNELNTFDAEIKLLQAQIAKTEIRAPFSGTIGLKSVSMGSYITPQSTIATLQNSNPVKIDFSIPEKYTEQVRIGNDIVFRIQGSDKKYSGKIYAIEPKIDPSTRTLRIRALSQNSKSEIFPGAFAEIELTLKEIDNAIMVPTEALMPDIKGQKVFLVRSGKAVPQPVVTGIRKERYIQITSGLQPGDTLVTSGLLQLRPGMPVRISEVLNNM